jgi:hypothetical protein
MAPPTIATPDETYVRWPRAGGFVREMLFDTVDSYVDSDRDARWWNVQWARAALTDEWRATEARPYDASMWAVTYKPFGYAERWRYLIEVNASIQVGDHVVALNYGLSSETRWTAMRLWADLIGGATVRLVVR